jgi:hypothetical protein
VRRVVGATCDGEVVKNMNGVVFEKGCDVRWVIGENESDGVALLCDDK